MAPPGNGIFVVRGEMSTLITAMKRGARWNSASYQEEEQDTLMKQFMDLKTILIQIEDLRLIEPNVFLGPFLDVIRSEETTGPITSLALSSVNKFLSYGLIDPTHSALPIIVDNIADAVTHARFVGTDQASDAVVLMKIIQVLRTLMLSPEGSALTNESVCEVMLSCFRICFEPRLNELLRRTAEHALKDVVLLLFMRLPQFAEERQGDLMRKLKMIAGAVEQTSKKQRKSKAKALAASKGNLSNRRHSMTRTEENKDGVPANEMASPTTSNSLQVLKVPVLATTPATPAGNIVDMQGKFMQTPTTALVATTSPVVSIESVTVEEDNLNDNNIADTVDEKRRLFHEDSVENDADAEEDPENPKEDDSRSIEDTDSQTKETKTEDFTNSMGVRFIPQADEAPVAVSFTPYGLPCIRELLRFIVSLCNPLDKQNTDTMMHMGLSLLTVALEVGADSIGKYDTLISIVKDDMCKNLFSLLNTERLTIFASDLQVCFLLFESLRVHLKFHLEYYLAKLSEIIANENPRLPYELRELALDNLLQFWRIPGFAAELYINYDCNLYCTNLLEDLIKLLSKNSLSATQTIYSIHQISLDGLLTIIDHVQKNCLGAKTGMVAPVGRHSRNNSNTDKIVIDIDLNTSGGESSGIENIHNFMSKTDDGSRFGNSCHRTGIVGDVLSRHKLMEIKQKKRILTQGTEMFNKSAENGIQYLQENGILNAVLDPMEVAHYLRENSGLDKTMIGAYVSKKKNVERKILETFVKSFDFANTPIDIALRQYLETFRLPGEAPLISLVMEHFADHWHKCNNEPFANTDSAFKLAYAIIMLNMDQHNYNAKRLNIPMTVDDFVKNLRGCDNNGDFNLEMLQTIYNRIKNEEIIMPAEQTGLVRENYLWKVLLRRGVTKDGIFKHVDGSAYDEDIFQLVWGPTLSALSFMFDKSNDMTYQKSVAGLSKGAAISSHFNLHENLDALVLTLCKFTTLLNVAGDANEIATSVNFGLNAKAQLAMKTVFGMIHEHGDSIRESWTNILDVIVQLFRLKLLPKTFMETEDFCEPSGRVTLILEKPLQKPESGLFSSLYSYLSSDGQRQPTYEEQEIIKVSKRCIKECQIDQIIAESKFLQCESLQRLLKCFVAALKPPGAHKSVGISYAEDIVVFLMEVMVKILIQNRDRLLGLWPGCRDQIYLLLMGSASCGYQYLLVRTTVALLKLAIYLMRNEELCSMVLQSLKMLLMLKPNVIQGISKQISIGLYELLKTSAQNIHTETDWDIVFTLLQCVGAGAIPPEFDDTILVAGTKSDGALSSEEDSGLPDRGYTSDSEIAIKSETIPGDSSAPFLSPSGENWILVSKDNDVTISCSTSSANSLTYQCRLLSHSSFAIVKCWDSLAFIVRNVAHITPYNFESCVRCIRTFVEASLNGGRNSRTIISPKHHQGVRRKIGATKKDHHTTRNRPKSDGNSSDSEDEDLMQRYESIAIQMLDLMHTLHTRTAQIFRWWAEEGGAVPQCSALWANGWCPLLQGIARLANDKRREVRTSAVTCLQRALLVHDLQTLTGPEWYSCFKQVLFPLLFDLLTETTSNIEPGLLEESRTRTATIMSKVFLHHLSPLITLPAFSDLWLEILEYLEKFMKIGSDMLYEAILESLKNMLLVMHSVGVFHTSDGTAHTTLWTATWTKITAFLPQLKEELFAESDVLDSHNIGSVPSVPPQDVTPLPVAEPSTQSHVSMSPPLQPIGQQLQSIILQQQNEPTTTGPIIIGQNVPAASPVPLFIQNIPPTMSSSPPNYLYKNPAPTKPIPVHPIQQTTTIEMSDESDEQSTTATEQIATDLPSEQVIPDSVPPPEIKQVTVDSSANQSPQIPISHLLAANNYPSLSNVPPNIAKSFAPIYVQPPNQQANTDIYNDYVQNPYNLTLLGPKTVPVPLAIASEATASTTDCDVLSSQSHLTQKLGVSNVFQSSNYFNSDGVVIPPGSEMLFGGP